MCPRCWPDCPAEQSKMHTALIMRYGVSERSALEKADTQTCLLTLPPLGGGHCMIGISSSSMLKRSKAPGFDSKVSFIAGRLEEIEGRMKYLPTQASQNGGNRWDSFHMPLYLDISWMCKEVCRKIGHWNGLFYAIRCRSSEEWKILSKAGSAHLKFCKPPVSLDLEIVFCFMPLSYTVRLASKNFVAPIKIFNELQLILTIIRT